MQDQVEEQTPPFGIKTSLPNQEIFTPTNVLVMSLVIIITLLGVWLVLVGRQKFKKKSKQAVLEVNPIELLLSQINRLGLPAEDQRSDPIFRLKFASDVSVYLRKVVGFTIDKTCEDWTTQEFKQNAAMITNFDSLYPVLEQMDFVRFADREMRRSDAQEWLQVLRDASSHLKSLQQSVATPSSTGGKS